MKARTTSTSSDEINTDASTAPATTDTDLTEDTNPIALDRNLYKSIKKMDRATLEGLIQDIYENGRKKGVKETQATMSTPLTLTPCAMRSVAYPASVKNVRTISWRS